MGVGTSSPLKIIKVKRNSNRATIPPTQDYPIISTLSEASLETLHLADNERQVSASNNKTLTIIHFNDVYNIEERQREPVGGASRFKTAVDNLLDKEPLVLFSGDMLAPSNMSVVTLGKQMVPVLNSLQVHAAVYGNHDFDFGVDHLVEIAQSTTFPWLMTNVLCKYTGRPLAEGKQYLIIERNNMKIGLLGLVEEEWLATLATLSIEDVIYTDYVKSAREFIPTLKEQGCTLIIALTHMRLPNDKRLTINVPEIHLILGGHDHDYMTCQINQSYIIKSGSDFISFSELGVTQSALNNSFDVNIVKHTITGNIPKNDTIEQIVKKYLELVEEGLDEEIAHIQCELDGRFKTIRSGETNLGNLITDIMSATTRADCALINSGTFRSNDIHFPGLFKMKDLVSILPMVDPLVVLEITGKQLLEALENGVSQYPKLEGRFPQVSGIQFTFDSTKPAGQRILSNTLLINGQSVISNKRYKLCTKSYLAAGKDGYNIFKTLPVLISEEEGPILSTAVRNYFTAQNSLSHGFHGSCTSIHSAIAAMAAKSAGIINPQKEGRIVIV